MSPSGLSQCPTSRTDPFFTLAYPVSFTLGDPSVNSPVSSPRVKKALLILCAMSTPVSHGTKWEQFDVVTRPVAGSVWSIPKAPATSLPSNSDPGGSTRMGFRPVPRVRLAAVYLVAFPLFPKSSAAPGTMGGTSPGRVRKVTTQRYCPDHLVSAVGT